MQRLGRLAIEKAMKSSEETTLLNPYCMKTLD